MRARKSPTTNYATRKLLLVSIHQIGFYIRTLCLYAFRLYILNMHIISMCTRIRMTIAGVVVRAVQAATGNVHCLLRVIVRKMCQFQPVQTVLVSTINHGPLQPLNKRQHIVQVLAIIDQQHMKNITHLMGS